MPAVIRVLFVNARITLGMPLGILFLVWFFNWALFATLADAVPPAGRTTGGLMAIYFVFGSGYLQTMTQAFPFALGMGVTRRAFYTAVALLVAVESAGFGVLLGLLNLLERATGGWGLRLRFFAIDFVLAGDPLRQWLVYAVPFVAVAFLGVFVGVVFKRWGSTGLWTVGTTTGVLLGGLAVLATWGQWWPAVGDWFAAQSVPALLAGYPLVLALLLGAGGWLAIRRATP
ncbi:hypothetical protein [Pseudonocardia humida]|uniref:hypothetical protein n=1 Tax=Pseudonocardia humida TaxID=2800819 RepID=UPI00207C87B3|nr:hypothetical protein [Pseudonocardia humida]